MVVEDEWGDIVAYGSVAGNAVEQTTLEATYREQIRDKYPKVSSIGYMKSIFQYHFRIIHHVIGLNLEPIWFCSSVYHWTIHRILTYMCAFECEAFMHVFI